MDLVQKHLDEFALAVWFCDDGHRDKYGAFFYTFAFSKDETSALAALLRSRFGLVVTERTNGSGQPYLYINASGRHLLDAIVARFAIPGMAYKHGGDSCGPT